MQLTDCSSVIKGILAASLIALLAFAAEVVGQDSKDPHRPPCAGVECRRVKSFVKAHYCGKPQGNGPDDGCEIRIPKKRPNIKVTANYECKWVDGIRHCQQHGQPSSEQRSALVGELQRLGLPTGAKGPTYFTVWQPSGSDWTLVEAYYDHIVGSDVTLCQVIAIVDKDSRLSVLRKVRFQETNANKNTVTTWSPLDLADANGDGEIDVILEADAYEDHWIEVDRMKGGSFQTIFSGLGYYL